MNAFRWKTTGWALAGVITLTSATAGCALLHSQAPQTAGRACPRPAGASVLEVLLDNDGIPARAQMRSLVPATARPGEHLLVRDADSGRVLGSFTAPTAAAGRQPVPPTPLPSGPTSFQAAKHQQAEAAYQAAACREQAQQSARERPLLAAWAARVVARLFLKSAPPPDVRDHGLSGGLNAAIADLSSLQQAQVPFGNRKVLAILGFDGAPTTSVPGLAAALPGVTVVVTGFPAHPKAVQAWTESIKHQGAAAVVVLTKSTSGELISVVSRGLARTTAQPTLTRS
jgi:hypothetical protein